MLHKFHRSQTCEPRATAHWQIAVPIKSGRERKSHAGHTQELIVVQVHKKGIGFVPMHNDNKAFCAWRRASDGVFLSLGR